MTLNYYRKIFWGILLMAFTEAPGQSDVFLCSGGAPVPLVDQTFSVDPEDFANSGDLATALDANWDHGSINLFSNSSFTDNPAAYFNAGFNNEFVIESKSCSRDVEVDTYMNRGILFLRMTDARKAIYFSHSAGNPGIIEFGIVEDAEDTGFRVGNYFALYQNGNPPGSIPGYPSPGEGTDGDFFTFGVSGMEIYLKYNGVEIVRRKSFLHLESGAVFFQPSFTFGIRRTEVRHFDNTPFLSDFTDYDNAIIDPRDFGLRSIQATGSILANSDQLILNAVPDPQFEVGDEIIVEIGNEVLPPGETPGERGTEGVGGTFPVTSYADAAERDMDLSPPLFRIAWLRSDRVVYFINPSEGGNEWLPIPFKDYYRAVVAPISLEATVLDVSGGGLTLTLDKTAVIEAQNAQVYLNNVSVFNILGKRPSVLTKHLFPDSATILVPAGDIAISGEIFIHDHPDWTLAGAGKNETKIFTPEGVPSATLVIYDCVGCEIRDFHLMGNARDHGFGLNPNHQLSGNFFPFGILFYFSHNARAENLIVTDVFQKTVGTSGANNVWAENIDGFMTDGLRAYVQWRYQWADSDGGGCILTAI